MSGPEERDKKALVQKKKAYVAPRLTSFGTVARLTRGAGGASADFMNNRFKRL